MRAEILLLLWAALIATVAGVLKELNVMGLFPMTGETWPGGGACLPAVEMAIRHVNARDDILKGYRMNLIWGDTMCDAGKATNIMYEMLYSEPTKHMILGPACSIESEVTAQASADWNITHLSYGSASPLLSNRQRFPRFFRLASPDTRYNLLRIAIAQHFNWKKIATINVGMDYFSAVTDDLIEKIKETDIEIISEEIFDEDPLSRIQSLKRKDARIIFMSAYENQGRRVICSAYQEGLFGPKIVWMFPGWYADNWWIDPNNDVSCTGDEMKSVVEGSFMTGFFYENINMERGIANLTVKEFNDLFILEEKYRPEQAAFEFLKTNCFDGVWGISIALNCTDAVLKEIGHPKSLEQFEYSDGDLGDIITSCTSNLSFLGVSGNVKFGSYGSPVKNIKLDQIQDGKKVMVGIYRTDVDKPFLEWHNGGIHWPDGIPPRDSTLVKQIEVLIPVHLYSVMACLSGFGILLAASLFVFNIVHRENVYVKLSSPNINNVLLLGCILTYTSVFMVSLEQQNVILCKMRTFTLTIGFSTAFGALFSKTWRVYKIFSNKKLLRLRIKDSQLIGIVLGLLAILCFVLLTWELIDPLYINTRFLKTEFFGAVFASKGYPFKNIFDFITAGDWDCVAAVERLPALHYSVYKIGTDAEVRPYIRVCMSTYQQYFNWCIYIIEGLLLAFGAFLSFETRKVKIAALNDSHLIGTCLYNVVVLSAVGLTLNLVLVDQVALLYGIISAILIAATTATQLIVFIPKIMAVYYPHRVAQDLHHSLNGSRLNTSITGRPSEAFAPRGPRCETMISTIKGTTSTENAGK